MSTQAVHHEYIKSSNSIFLRKHTGQCGFCLEFITPLYTSREFDPKYFGLLLKHKSNSENTLQQFGKNVGNCKVLIARERMRIICNFKMAAIRSE